MVAVVPADLLTRRWKLATWLCAIAVLLALLFMAQYLTSPTEMVRIRNALLVVVTEPGASAGSAAVRRLRLCCLRKQQKASLPESVPPTNGG